MIAPKVNGEYVPTPHGRHPFTWKHNGPVYDKFGTLIKSGDRIIKCNKYTGKYVWYYVVDVRQDHMIACRLTGFRTNIKTFKMGQPRVHTNLDPRRLCIDHEWRKNHVR